MNRNYSYKKTEGVEVDLMDLFRSFCTKWKQITMCAIVGALLLGGYGYLKNRESEAADSIETEEVKLTEEEQQGVAEAILLNQEVSSMQEYMDNSILMQIDTYHKKQVVMLYSIDEAEIQLSPKIAESYSDFLTNGGAAQAVQKTGQKSNNIEAVYLQELITVRRMSGSAEQTGAAGDSGQQGLIYLEATGKDDRLAKQLAEDLQIVLEEYSSTVRKNCGDHHLKLLSSTAGEVIDSSLLAQQQKQRELLKAGRANLKTVEEGLNGKQKMVYEEETEKEEDSQIVPDNGRSAGISPRRIVSGFCGGILVYACIFLCLYLIRNAIRSESEFKAHYAFPTYGSIPLKVACGRSGVFEHKQAQALGRIRLTCKKQEINKLFLAEELVDGSYGKEAVEHISGQLQEWGIQTVVGKMPGNDISKWNVLEDIGTVLIICGIGHTSYSMVDHAMDFYLENDINVIGALLLG